jgi:uncharacterized protein (TIGR00303 family)
MLRVYTQELPGHLWLRRYRGRRPRLACVLGFTETGLVPGISAAGASPEERRTTAIADAEFLYRGPQPNPEHPLPSLAAGISPVLISRAVLIGQRIPLMLFNAGLPQPPSVPHIDLQGTPAQCLQSGEAMPLEVVRALFHRGLGWGQRLANEADPGYLMVGECVVGGTTTALAVLLGLGFAAEGMVSSSHVTCNHDQKQALVRAGLHRWRSHTPSALWADPLALVAAVGDPMQVVAAAMTLAASRYTGVMLAGGTQMLAVYALARAIAAYHHLPWQPEKVVVGTTRWVAEDASGNTVGLAALIGDVPLIGTQFSFGASRYPQLRRYEEGYVKEGVAAGGCAIAAHLYQNWQQADLLAAIETLVATYENTLTPAPQ